MEKDTKEYDIIKEYRELHQNQKITDKDILDWFKPWDSAIKKSIREREFENELILLLKKYGFNKVNYELDK